MNNTTLCLIDISPFLYSGIPYKSNKLVGPVIATDGGYCQPSLKVGGVAFLFDKLGQLLKSGYDVILCSDRPPTIKQSFYQEYKATRFSKNGDEVRKQRIIAERIAEDCDIPITYRDGVEADDLLYSYWSIAQRLYEKIDVYVCDSDMSMLVNDKTSICPCNSKGRSITMENFEQMALPKQLTQYNGVVMNKIIFGDTSDNIAKVLRPKDAYALWDCVTGDLALGGGHARIINDLLIKRHAPAAWQEKLMLQLQVVFPLEQEVSIPAFNYDMDRFAEWCRAMDIYGYGRCSSTNRTMRVTQQLYEEFAQREGEETCALYV